jgi:TM2 domain-containing membrane protein YozV
MALQDIGGNPSQPKPTQQEWLLTDGVGQFGPFSVETIATMYAAGQIRNDARVWREGLPQWAPLSTIIPLRQGMPSYQPQDFSPSTQKVSSDKLAAGLLAILLGCLGIHKFMLGFTGAGIIMLLVSVLTFGFGAPIMAIIGLIEGIIYLTKSDADFYRDYVVNRRQWF